MTDSVEQRRKERDARAARSTRAGIGGRVVTMAVRLLVVPLSIGVLGAERYGLWASAWSLINWLSLSEAGIGTGLLNAVGMAKGRDDDRRARSHVATAVVILSCVGALAIAVAALFARFGPVASLLGVSGRGELEVDARAMVVAAGVVMGLTLLTNVVPQTLSALQRQYIGSYGTVGTSLAVLGALLVARQTGVSAAGFALVVGLPPIAMNLLLGGYTLWRLHPELRFTPADASPASAREILGTGGMAFAIQLGELAMVQSANVLISNRLGPAQVTPFAVTFSLLYSGMYFVNFLVQPLWAAYAEAWSRGDVVWVRERYRVTLQRVGLLGLLGLGGAIAIGRPLIHAWAGAAAVPSWPLLVCMCVFFLVWILAGCAGVLASGLGLFGRRGVVVALTSGGFVAGSWLLLPHWGAAAIPCVGAVTVGVQGLVAWRLARARLRDAAPGR